MKGPSLPAPRFATLVEAMENASGHPSGLTFVDLRERERVFSWTHLRHSALRIAAGLLNRGVEPGDRVALVMRTSPEFVSVFFGALSIGAVPVPLYPPVRLGRLDEYRAATVRMLKLSEAQVVVADRDIRMLIGEAIAAAGPRLGCCSPGVLRESGEIRSPIRSDSDSLALIQFSSGSTVDPKPVALSHRNILSHLMALEQIVRPRNRDRGVSWLPLYHDMGLIGCLLLAVHVPGPLVLISPEHFLAKPSLWLRALSRHKGTMSVAPNFAYSYCAQRIRGDELSTLDLSSWRLALCGAEPVSAKSLRNFASHFASTGFRADSLRPVYGLSEATLAVTAPEQGGIIGLEVDRIALARSGKAEPGDHEIVSVGVPIAGTEVEVRDSGGRVSPDGRLGRIYVRGPSVMTGYFRKAGLALKVIDAAGWLDTGDLGFIKDARLFIHGRAKDVVIVNGANHSAQEFEECVNDLAGVRPGCSVALGVPLEPGGSEALLILAEKGSQPSPGLAPRIVQRIASQTGVVPGRVELLEPGTLPRTSSGKMRRAEALRRWLAGELTAPKRISAFQIAKVLARGAVALRRAEPSDDL